MYFNILRCRPPSSSTYPEALSSDGWRKKYAHSIAPSLPQEPESPGEHLGRTAGRSCTSSGVPPSPPSSTFPRQGTRGLPGARSSVPAGQSVCPTAPGKPDLAYLEDRGQVLSHFQCLSLHRVNHILHPRAGVAASPATGWAGQPGQGPGVRKCPRSRRLASAPGGRHPRGRDETGRTGRGGGAAGAARARSLQLRQRAADRAQLSPGRYGGRQGRVEIWGRNGRTRTPRLLCSCLLPSLSSSPFLLPLLSCRSSAT